MGLTVVIIAHYTSALKINSLQFLQKLFNEETDGSIQFQCVLNIDFIVNVTEYL